MKNSKNFGKALCDLRKSKNIKIEKISQITKINEKYFESFESGDFSFKNEIYVKLFLREYINVIDSSQLDRIMQQFNELNDLSDNKSLTFLADENNNETQNDEPDLNEIFEYEKYSPKKIALIITSFIMIVLIFRVVFYLSNT